MSVRISRNRRRGRVRKACERGSRICWRSEEEGQAGEQLGLQQVEDEVGMVVPLRESGSHLVENPRLKSASVDGSHRDRQGR
jgi:hypothetical protein